VPFFVQTTGDLNNRNDVFSKLAINVGKATKGGDDSLKRAAEEEDSLPAMAGVEAGSAMEMNAEMQKKLKDKTTKLMQRRVERWDELMQRQGRR
jgi:hypothetical protein